MSDATYDPAGRRWRGGLVTWPRHGSVRAGRASASREPAARGGLVSTRYRWPTLMRFDGNGVGGFAGSRQPTMVSTLRGWLVPAWCEWLMGFPEGWTGA